MKLRALALGALTLAGCSKNAAAPVGVSDIDRPAQAARKKTPANEPMRTHLVTIVPERTIGPFLARRPGPAGREDKATALAAWVTPPEGSGRRIVAAALSGRGEPRGGERTVAKVPIDTTDLVVGSYRGPVPGFLLAWTSLTDRGEALFAAVVGDDGIPQGKVIELSRTGEDVVWIEIVPTDTGAVCLWAEETGAGDAYLVAASIEGTGHVRATPARVARGATAWHAFEIPGGVGVSVVSSPPPSAEDLAHGRRDRQARSRPGSLTYHTLDLDGHPHGAPVVIAREPTVSGDMHVARDGGRTLFAWTDRVTEEPVVALATLDADGTLTGPTTVVEERGGAGLVGLDAGPSGAVLAWEAPLRPKGESRRVHMAPIVEGRPSRRGHHTLVTATASLPEIAATRTGYAALASMRDCAPDAPSCDGADVLATVFRFDANGTLVQREPLAYAGEVPPSGWGLRCEGDDCIALTASSTLPTRILAAEVHPRTNVAPPAPPAPATKTDGPRVEDVHAVVSGETVVDLEVTPWSGGQLLTTLSAPPETPRERPTKPRDRDRERDHTRDRERRRGREDEPRTGGFVLATRVVDAEGKASAPIVLSPRALAVGGISVAQAENPEDGGVVAWVARENGDPEVHVTRVDKRGKRTNDVQLTTTKGDAQDVAVTAVPGGFLVAWIDGRDGNGEVYATKVGMDLARTAREERITRAPGDASDLVALRDGAAVWLAWADARESPRDGLADIYVASVATHDAKRKAADVRVLPTAAHSRTPKLVRSEAGLELAWIEEAPFEATTPSHAGFGAMWVTLDAQGAPLSKPRMLPLAGEGAATSVAIEVAGGAVRGVVARSGQGAIALDAVVTSEQGLRAHPLLSLDGPPSLDVALALQAGTVFFNDEGERRSDRRARRAVLAWPR